MKHLLALFIFLSSFSLQAQFATLSEKAEISVITVGPGPNLYDAFGHSAFRIKDPALALDRAYNYGTFDVTESGFYFRFSLGVAEYKLAAYSYQYFENNYINENRWIKEQVLNLNQEQKQKVFEALETNHLPENRYYRYDPFFDNCATRMRDIIKDALGDKLILSGEGLPKATIRSLVDENSFNHLWMDLGIDFALGNILDKPASTEHFMYLPDYVFSIYNASSIKTDSTTLPIVKQVNEIYSSDFYEQRKESLSPTIVFAILAVVVIIFTLKDYKNKSRARFMDFAILFLTGLLGLILLVLWFGTYHSTTVNNLNLLWAFAPNLVLAFYVVKRNPPRWVRSFVRILFILLLGMTFAWLFKVQVYNTALIPIMLMLGIRYIYLWNKGLSIKL